MKNSIILNTQKGMAILEVLPLLLIFLLLLRYGLGLFGVVHSSILHSIAARSYAFETLRNKTNTIYFRDTGSGIDNPLCLDKDFYRFHFVRTKQIDNEDKSQVAHKLSINFTDKNPVDRTTANTHNSEIFKDERRARVKVNPVWLQIGYGLCINSRCQP